MSYSNLTLKMFLGLQEASLERNRQKRRRTEVSSSPRPLWTVDDEQGALAFLSQVLDPRATHECWAYNIKERYRFSDDGEPGGTAGRPIYAAIENSGVDGVMVVVTRYFGGTKLGTGGLVRAYGGIAADCLKDAPTHIVKAKISLVLKFGFDHLGAVYPLLQLHGTENIKESYDEDDESSSVEIQLSLDAGRADELESSLTNACRGGITIQRATTTNS
ncbi:uncharacterized protein LOC9643245 [Selaginella moellendorffii]|uniref:uncharacterized protein LOC9643245 n=1 Tax=Selaginella moellendorffii TaxID=88036 RepID=UPI000D1CBF70|nr:uncharacterized protein LOC9643245 [Selaginella moellendorffii]|eukprot:XP_024516676.1 uncharacterized protein LOC9643245 [Selaginella moellendorffii]